VQNFLQARYFLVLNQLCQSTEG